jgi:hypothetical protein
MSALAARVSSETRFARLADDFEASHHGVLRLLVREERRVTLARECDGVVNRVPYVLQVDSVVGHSGTASATMRVRR